MRKSLTFLLLIIFLSGCATVYRVRVNGYLSKFPGTAAINPGVSFFVIENTNERNPILEAEIKSKIERLLQEKGYSIGSKESADFYLNFSYSINSGRNVTEIRREYVPGGTETIQTVTSEGKTRSSYVTLPGYTTYVPYRVTEFTSMLRLEVIDANILRNSKEKKIVWVEENSNTSENADIRDTINYLLVASFGQFGKDTGKSIIVNVAGDDPGVKKMIR